MNKRLLHIIFSLFLILTFFACEKGSNKYNALYQKGKNEKDVKILQKGFEKADPYFSKLCLTELCNLLPKQKSVEFARKGLKRYSDSQEVLELLVSLLYDQRDFSSVVLTIENNNQIAKNHEINRYYFSSIIKLSKQDKLSWDESFCGEIKAWYQNNSFSSSHNRFFNDFASIIDFDNVVKTRQLAYLGNYSKAALLIEKSYPSKEDFFVFAESLSYVEFTEIADTFVLGCNNRKEFSSYFANAALLLSMSEKAFYSVFSAARILEKQTGSNADVLKYYDRAIYLAPESNFDRALWYYLRGKMNFSLSEGYQGFLEFANAWKEPEYFDDIIDTFSASLLSKNNWNEYFELFSIIYPYLSEISQGKTDYLFGRLIEENLIDYGNGSVDLAFSYYEKAFSNPETDIYYRFLAGIKLDKEPKILPEQYPVDSEIFPEEEFLQILIQDDVSSVYNFAIKNKKKISEDSAISAIKALEKAGEKEHNFYPEALRLATAFVSKEENVKHLYPRFFSEDVKEICEEFGILEYVLYALIRTESYFDYDINSVAGAVGLCQLMPSTASDVARKLKYKEYDLLNPRTNLTFGGYYLGEMVSRSEENYVLGLCSYNAGINKVRSWKKANQNLPIDLFLETIPYEETRNYGKKLIKASSIYGMLYYQVSPKEVASKMGVF